MTIRDVLLHQTGLKPGIPGAPLSWQTGWPDFASTARM
jgi:hypothetical protein